MAEKRAANHLVVSVLGKDQPGIVDSLTRAVAEADCNISDSRMTVLGSEFAVIMLVSGNWSSIARLEDLLPKVADKLDLHLSIRRTEPREAGSDTVPYAVEVVAMDHPGIVHDISNFFSTRGINVEDLYTGSYQAPHTGTPMFSLHMTIGIRSNISIAGLRGEFLDFCDSLNLDAMLAPVK